MTLTILYLNSCRRERLRDAFAHTLRIIGPLHAASITSALQRAYDTTRSTRVNYNFSMHALKHVEGLEGLVAISLIKEAWNEGALAPLPEASLTDKEPVIDITHPSTTTTQ